MKESLNSMKMYATEGTQSNVCKTKTRKNDKLKCGPTLKLAGMPQTNEPISAASGPKFTIL